MKRLPITAALIASLVWGPATELPAAAGGLPTVETLVERVTGGWRSLKLELTARMTVTHPRRRPSLSGLRIRRGGGHTRIDFLSPERDRGKVFLQKGDRAWLYLPRPDRLIEVPARRNPLAGGDLFGDLLPGLPASSSAAVEPSEEGPVLVLTGSAENAGETSRIYFDSEGLVAVRREVYASSGRILKTLYIDETRTWEGVKVPWDVRLVDHLKPGTEVRIVVEEVAKLEADPDIFSEKQLRPEGTEP